MRAHLVGLTVAAALMLAVPARAQATDANETGHGRQGEAVVFVGWQPRVLVTGTEPRRPAAMVPRYVTLAGLQVLDIYTTYSALGRGAREANPLMAGRSVGTTIAVKAASSAVSILIAERLWKHNKAAAIGCVVAANLVTGFVVANNYRVLGQVGRDAR